MLRRLLPSCCLLFLVVATGSSATPRAIIVTGLATNDTQAARLATIAANTREGLIARGVSSANILSLAPTPGAPLRRDTVLAALAPAPNASDTDETWLILLGTSAPARDGQPAFQLSGPRLTAADLAATVGKLPGKKFVVVATTASGGFLPPLLALADTEAASATADTGEINEPRFAEFWAETLVARPGAPFPALAAEASERVAAFYQAHSLAQGEHARLIDRASGRILSAPFSAALTASAGSQSNPAPPPPVDIAALSFPKPTTNDEIELRPADEESLALLAAARVTADGSEHAAHILRTEIEILVARDFSARETWRTRAYVRTGEALDSLGTLRLPFDPPFVSSRLVAARVIRPDGSQRLLNPAARAARLAAEAEAGRSAPETSSRFALTPSFVELPDVTADCIVEAEWIVEHRTDGTLPEFSREWHLARAYPQHGLRLSATLPAETRWRAFAPNLPAPVTATDSPGSVTHVWDLAELPAREPRLGDPPTRTITPWVGISSVESWEHFAAWYRRIAAGSDTAGPGVDALAAEIAATYPDRADRLRAAYERVAALRYVAIELGVGAFRPRTPEQVWHQRFGDCKDKANLLVAVLARLGIDAEFALVNRFNATFTEFPSWQFNHAVARVPAAPAEGQAHDLWLDSTDRLVPLDVVAPGNLGRQALVFNRDFSSATFHEITAAQEPPATWREHYDYDRTARRWTLELRATGSAEVHLRHLFANLNPTQRRAFFLNQLGYPFTQVSELRSPDPYSLSEPFKVRVAFGVDGSPDAFKHTPPALLPGLRLYFRRIAESRDTLVWDEGRDWTYEHATGDTADIVPVPGKFDPRTGFTPPYPVIYNVFPY